MVNSPPTLPLHQQQLHSLSSPYLHQHSNLMNRFGNGTNNYFPHSTTSASFPTSPTSPSSSYFGKLKRRAIENAQGSEPQDTFDSLRNNKRFLSQAMADSIGVLSLNDPIVTGDEATLLTPSVIPPQPISSILTTPISSTPVNPFNNYLGNLNPFLAQNTTKTTTTPSTPPTTLSSTTATSPFINQSTNSTIAMNQNGSDANKLSIILVDPNTNTNNSFNNILTPSRSGKPLSSSPLSGKGEEPDKRASPLLLSNTSSSPSSPSSSSPLIDYSNIKEIKVLDSISTTPNTQHHIQSYLSGKMTPLSPHSIDVPGNKSMALILYSEPKDIIRKQIERKLREESKNNQNNMSDIDDDKNQQTTMEIDN